jgi:hypothetical protein
MDQSIAVILNVFRREDLLQTQIDSIINQTKPPSRIFIWNNGKKVLSGINSLSIPLTIFNSSDNLGVWARFSCALNSSERFIAVFDDDTIPGNKWFENCLENIDNGNRLLGTRGLRFLSKHSYSPFESYGWDNPNEELVEVDIIGHAWFFENKMLTAFWSQFNNRYLDNLSGEDIHLSFSIQKLGYKSFVPPHPIHDMELWGSKPEIALAYGGNEFAISSSPGSLKKFTNAYRFYINKGFSIYYKSHKSPNVILINNSLREKMWIQHLMKKPKFSRIIKSIKFILNKIGVQF